MIELGRNDEMVIEIVKSTSKPMSTYSIFKNSSKED